MNLSLVVTLKMNEYAFLAHPCYKKKKKKKTRVENATVCGGSHFFF